MSAAICGAATSFDGDPLEWTGTGKELFKGFVTVVFLILMPMGILGSFAQQLTLNKQEIVGGLLQFVLSVTYFMLLPMGMYRARRYRLSRTLWRGIRGTQTGMA